VCVCEGGGDEKNLHTTEMSYFDWSPAYRIVLLQMLVYFHTICGPFTLHTVPQSDLLEVLYRLARNGVEDFHLRALSPLMAVHPGESVARKSVTPQESGGATQAFEALMNKANKVSRVRVGIECMGILQHDL
jgi:hypothetical protein